MTRRHNNKVPTLLLLALAVLLLAALTGCERKVEGTVAVEDTVSDQCFNCHNGQLDAMQGEWANSVHASGANVDYTSRPGQECVRCHNQEGFIYWINEGAILANAGNAKAIGCFACHNPHENGDLRLRIEAPVTMKTGATFNIGAANLCANCHQASNYPTITDDYTLTSDDTRFGPHHGPQGDLLLGTGGYTGFPDFVAGSSLHKDVLAEGCVTCHMGYAQSHEGYNVGGHSFNMLDEDGNSLVSNCTASACHGAGTLAFTKSTNSLEPYDVTLTADPVDWDNDGTVEGYQTEMEGMLDSLGTLLELQGIYNPDPPPGKGTAVPGTYADGNLVGAYWNFITVEEDRSMGIHNWEYMRSIIQASIDYVSAMPAPTR